MDPFVKNIPKITVLMPVYNCELYIREAVDSILNQSYADFELLIIDDASSDETVSIIKKYTDDRIHLIQKKSNQGLIDSLNLGLQVAKGKYIARMDGDDISLPDRFTKQVAFLDNNDEIVVCGSIFKILGSNELIKVPEFHNDIALVLLRNNCIAHPSVMLRAETIHKNKIVYDGSKIAAEDYAMWGKLVNYGKLHNLQECLLEYRIHDKQVSNEFQELQKKMGQRIRIEINLSNLSYFFNEEERDLITKICINSMNYSFTEVKLVLKLQKALLFANQNGVYEPVGFQKYLDSFDDAVVNHYFKIARKNPLKFIEYLIIKKQLRNNLRIKQELKYFIKSIFFWNK
ncbi:glycosyltransferase family 2 protein [Flavobacterium sp. LB2P84]|uniref:glycosyltransferase family 2 protein n=1 Tax=Flavobacterium yafengii TaxID=3041253 RepID=UPI0024A81452|nr:glycosyltransferase family 2 protein [Flavobacterium yafengii]MDI6034175.1 glycosyltransferase family 2 protein [Flavobacterium yafengii]